MAGAKTRKQQPCQAILGEGDMRCTGAYSTSYRRPEEPPFCVTHLRSYRHGKRITGYDGKVYDISEKVEG